MVCGAKKKLRIIIGFILLDYLGWPIGGLTAGHLAGEFLAGYSVLGLNWFDYYFGLLVNHYLLILFTMSNLLNKC